MDNLHTPDLKPSKTVRQKRRDKRLHEEVIETGRHRNGRTSVNCRKINDSGRKKKLQAGILLDSVPARESIRDGRCVCLRDNLEPLKRWLTVQVGRPWADVYAELGKIANPNSMHGAHIRQHLWEYVAKKAWLDEDGGIVTADQYGRLGKSCWGRPDYFVHPETGLFLKISGGEKGGEKGPFPQKARWKTEKQSLKSQIRQGIGPKTSPEKPGLDATGWPCIRTRLKWLAPGERLDFLQNGNIFRATVVHAEQVAARGQYRLNGLWAFMEKDWLSLDVKIVAVFAGEKFKAGQAVHFWANKNGEANWTAYDNGRLFGNRGLGFKHWAMAQKQRPEHT